MGIVGNNSLWLTHYRYLNDTAEYNYGMGLASAELEKRHDAKGVDVNDWARYGHRFMFGEREVYVASFSTAKDSLSQWRAYGGQTGYSIGFDGRALSQLAQENGIYLCKCSYDSKEHSNLINEVLDRSEERGFQRPFWLSDNPEIEDLFLKTFCVIKPPAFKDEQEWRLIYAPKTILRNGNESADRNITYRSATSFLVPFANIEFSREKFCRALHNIYVGPNKYMDEALLSAKGYVESEMKPHRHLGPGVLATKSTYRDC